ncbi:hypothetical protein KR032_006703 [Drosophila birchii]|nr:hypothetical protein KR032_006703 [Drosophila birchii]
MEHKAAKRSRSVDGHDDDDANNNPIQRKVWVSQRMSDARDPAKMREVHERTTKMLFKGAAAASQEKAGVAAAPARGGEAAATTLHEQYQLLGDGTILVRDMRPDAVNPSLERRKSRCCQRRTLIHGSCINCTMDLCEECGYSCTECSQFICRSCVTVL